jgi:hypothetical protein
MKSTLCHKQITKRLVTALAVNALWFLPSVAAASGFVKGAGEHYSKVSVAVEGRQTIGEGDVAFHEDVRAVSLYSEVGLPIPWKSQVSFYVPWKTVVRKSVTLGDQFQSASFADSRLGLKLDLGSHSFFSESSFPLAVFLASDTGYVLPTTADSYREGNEASRYKDAPGGASFLVARVDRGISRWTQGLGLSAVSGPVWLSSRFSISQDVRPKSPERNFGVDLGVGLPWNSWAQVGFERIAALAESGKVVDGEGKERPPPLKLETKIQASVGLTVWDGLALEVGFTQTRPQPSEGSPISRVWSAGVSYRSL